jgi:transcriptional regulator
MRIWGMPDWENPSDYPFTLDDVGWTWEFLRRNAEYREDYGKAVKTLGGSSPETSAHLKVGGLLESFNTRLWWNLGFRWWIYGPIRDPARDDPPRFITGFPWQPNSEEVESFFMAVADESEQEGSAVPHSIPKLQHPAFATLVFDLRKPLGPQVKRAHEILKMRQGSMPKTSKPPNKGSQNWRDYLRVLDAREAKMTLSQIAKVVLAGEFGNVDGKDPVKKIEKYWAQAKRLRANPLSLLDWSPIQTD